jgi:3-oxoacyl-[acyl-carrier-protein] synthase III
MRFQGVSIESICCALPPRIVSSAQVEERLAPVYERLHLPAGRLEMMTGIRERRFFEPGTQPSQAATLAGQKALEAAAIGPEAIGCIIHASVCRDFLEPATASVVHRNLNLPREAAIFDLSNACLGVLNGMVQVAAMIQSGQIRAGLVVAGETAESLHEATIERLLNDPGLTRNGFKDHFASLTIGSGAAAVVLADSALTGKGHELLGGTVRTDSQANELCREDKDGSPSDKGPLMSTDSEALLHAGCALAGDTWRLFLKELEWNRDTPNRIFTHQVGAAHKRLLFDLCDLDPEIDFPTVQTLGNTGSAALPTAFARGVEEGKVQAGDRIALLGIGSGLSCLMLGVRW